MRAYLFAAFTALTPILAAPFAAAQSNMAEVCASLERPNIDCTCVANRIAVFERMSTDRTRPVITEGYLQSVGQDNALPTHLEAMMSDPMTAMVALEAYEQVGGRPENITEYEQGCVIAGAEPLAISVPDMSSAVGSYIEACTASTSDKRFCTCDVARKKRHVSDQEFEAYYRSFTDYSDGDATSRDEINAAQARGMGVSADRFAALNTAAREKMGKYETQDAFYCDAVTWADDKPGLSAEARLEAGFEPGTVGFLNTSAVKASNNENADASPVDRARTIMAQSCSNEGNSDQYCTCYAQDFETRIVEKAPSPNVTLAFAAMNMASSDMSTSEQVMLMQSLPQADHQAAAMMLMSNMDLGETCTQGISASSEKLEGTARERMLHICVAENEDEALCGCMVEKVEASFPPDDFELFVDIREAEFFGSEDAFAQVAEDRGLTKAEAETALENNPALVAGAMAMGGSLMQCMGGMPAGMPGFPGMPGQ